MQLVFCGKEINDWKEVFFFWYRKSGASGTFLVVVCIERRALQWLSCCSEFGGVNLLINCQGKKRHLQFFMNVSLCREFVSTVSVSAVKGAFLCVNQIYKADSDLEKEPVLFRLSQRYRHFLDTKTGQPMMEVFIQKIFSCGCNDWRQLILSNGSGGDVYSPIEITITNGATFCIAGQGLIVVFIGGRPPQNTPNRPIQQNQWWLNWFRQFLFIHIWWVTCGTSLKKWIKLRPEGEFAEIGRALHYACIIVTWKWLKIHHYFQLMAILKKLLSHEQLNMNQPSTWLLAVVVF